MKLYVYIIIIIWNGLYIFWYWTHNLVVAIVSTFHGLSSVYYIVGKTNVVYKTKKLLYHNRKGKPITWRLTLIMHAE